ncbi:MAG: hypothetical protein ABI112_09420 [Terracoccus sp.]
MNSPHNTSMRRRFVVAVGLVTLLSGTLGINATSASAHTPSISYRYTDLSAAPVPAGYLFNDFTAGLDFADRVYGTSYAVDSSGDAVPKVSEYAHGTTTILQRRPSVAHVVNALGVVGGSVLTNVAQSTEQAALFFGDHADVIPRQPGEISSVVVALSNLGVAIVRSYDGSHTTYLRYWLHHKTRLDFGPDVTAPDVTGINDAGFVSGIDQTSPQEAFRYKPYTGASTLLAPQPTESNSWGLGINDQSDVLGYSFNFGSTERIGAWDPRGDFHTYFVEGIPKVPTISNSLLFNNDNQIVITFVANSAPDYGTSYLIPRPGTRLNLTDLVENPPTNFGAFGDVTAENDRGSLVGSGLDGTDFLLERQR